MEAYIIDGVLTLLLLASALKHRVDVRRIRSELKQAAHDQRVHEDAGRLISKRLYSDLSKIVDEHLKSRMHS